MMGVNSSLRLKPMDIKMKYKKLNKKDVKWRITGQMVAIPRRLGTWDIWVRINVTRIIPIAMEGSNFVLFRNRWEIRFRIPPKTCLMLLKNKQK